MKGRTMFYASAFLRKSGPTYKGVLKYKDENGKWRQIQKALKADGKRAAQKELDEWHEEMENKALFGKGVLSRPNDVVEFVSQYIDTLEQSQSIERSTVVYYRVAQRHIAEGLSEIGFDELNADIAQAWVNEQAKLRAPSTVKKDLNVLKAAYKAAVNRRVIPYSPLEAVKAPKLKRNEPNALDAPSVQRLISYLDIAGSTPTNLAIKLALLTGMRESEICGLRWQDIDTEQGVIRIRKVVGRDATTTYLKEPKTGGSRRDIPISEAIAKELEQRRHDMKKECMAAGIPLKKEMFVFGRIDGNYMNPHTLWREWKAIAKSLGLVGTEGKTPTFHDLRHTYATVAIAAGQDVKSVSSILGHANAAMTLNIYASADPEAKRQTMNKVSEIMTQTPREAEILELGKTGTDNE